MSDVENVTRSSFTNEADRENHPRIAELATAIQERLAEIVDVLREWRGAATQNAIASLDQETSAIPIGNAGDNAAEDGGQPGRTGAYPQGTAAVTPIAAERPSWRDSINSGVVAGANRGSDRPEADALATAVVQQTVLISNWSRQHNVALRNAVAAVDACVRELSAMQQTTARLSESLNQIQQSLSATGERARAQRLSGR